MSGIVLADILDSLDRERKAAGEPSARGNVVREHSADGSECRIVFSHCAAEEIRDVIAEETARADSDGYRLEWKVYDHDPPPGLRDHLRAAGFEPDAAESVLVLPLTEAALTAFSTSGYEVRRTAGAAGLDDVAEIASEIGRTDVEQEKHRLVLSVQDKPDGMSIHVAYVDGRPVASGRVYFRDDSDVAELAGGRTKTTHRNQGLFTALVGTRLAEALERNRRYVFVDALPSSEPILRKRGFQLVTHTQPFTYNPTPRG